jgi:hypothetical protein
MVVRVAFAHGAFDRGEGPLLKAALHELSQRPQYRIVGMRNDPDIVVCRGAGSPSDPGDRLEVDRVWLLSQEAPPESFLLRGDIGKFRARIMARASASRTVRRDVPKLPHAVWDALLSCYSRCLSGEVPPIPGCEVSLQERLYRFYSSDPVVRAHWETRMPNSASFHRYYTPHVRDAYLEGRRPYHVHGDVEDEVFDRLFDESHMFE